jgi:hypothetical protein
MLSRVGSRWCTFRRIDAIVVKIRKGGCFIVGAHVLMEEGRSSCHDDVFYYRCSLRGVWLRHSALNKSVGFPMILNE